MVKNLPANAGDVGSVPGLARSPGVGNGNPLKYSCLENPMDRRAWRATVYQVVKSRTGQNAHTKFTQATAPKAQEAVLQLPMGALQDSNKVRGRHSLKRAAACQKGPLQQALTPESGWKRRHYVGPA